MSYKTNIFEKTEENNYFRNVLFTGAKSQLVVMNIPPNGEIGEEVHHNVEQTLFFMKGFATSILDGVEGQVMAGDVVVVMPGVKHNFINTGKDPLKVFTVYSPANHLDGRVHKTKADADADVADEDFGEKVL